MSSKRILAKYPGKCSRCQEPIAKGDPILWSRGEKPRHAECPERDPVAEAEAAYFRRLEDVNVIRWGEAPPDPYDYD